MMLSQRLGFVSSIRLLGLACLMLMASLWAAPAAVLAASDPNPAGFLSNLDDIPLMPGLIERKDLAINFDKAEGRIVEAQAEGRLAAQAVTRFYAATLPQLGWLAQGDNRFMREGEELRLSMTIVNQTLVVRFTLSPRP